MLIPNLFAPIAEVLVDPTTGEPYVVGGADTAWGATPPANMDAPVAIVLIDPTTGLPYSL